MGCADSCVARTSWSESKSDAQRLDLDRRIKLQIHAAKLSSVGGSLLFRGLDAALGQTEMAGWRMLSDSVITEQSIGR